MARGMDAVSRWARALAAAALFAGAATACGPGGERQPAAAARSAPAVGQVGGPAPALQSRTLDGRSVTLAGLAGRPVLLNVWATWCHPCQDEIPVLQALHTRYAPAGLQVIGVSIDDAGREADITAFARRFGMTYPIWLDPDQAVMPAFSVVGVPTTFLVGADGRLAWRRTGEVKAGDPRLAALLDSLLVAAGTGAGRPGSGDGATGSATP